MDLLADLRKHIKIFTMPRSAAACTGDQAAKGETMGDRDDRPPSMDRSLCRVRAVLLAALSLFSLSGCETLNPLTVGAGVASYVATGKGLADHAIGTFMNKDCNILEGLLRPDRHICEPIGSAATASEFKGIFNTGSLAARERRPRLRLSESVQVARRAVPDGASPPLPLAPALRLSDSIAPRVTSSPPRIAAADSARDASS